MSDSGGGYGQMDPADTSSQFNATHFMINQILGRCRTMQVVQVKAVNGTGLAPVGFVDVQAMVNLLDGQGTATPHGIIHNVPYTRIQGGKNAVIIDPEVDDIGWMAVADRDISSVKANKAVSNPGSYRRNDLADGVYLGGILNGTPEQYVMFSATGMKLVDKNGNILEMKAGMILATTPILACTGAVIAGYGGGDQVGVQTHMHPTAANGPPSSPTPGT